MDLALTHINTPQHQPQKPLTHTLNRSATEHKKHNLNRNTTSTTHIHTHVRNTHTSTTECTVARIELPVACDFRNKNCTIHLHIPYNPFPTQHMDTPHNTL